MPTDQFPSAATLKRHPFVFRFLLPLLTVSCAAFAQDATDSAAVRDLREQIAVLRAEVAALRLEVRRFKDSSSVVSLDSARDSLLPAMPAGTEPRYRCSKSGNKRHNQSCKYFKTADRPCGPGDGVPCKLCGG